MKNNFKEAVNNILITLRIIFLIIFVICAISAMIMFIRDAFIQ